MIEPFWNTIAVGAQIVCQEFNLSGSDSFKIHMHANFEATLQTIAQGKMTILHTGGCIWTTSQCVGSDHAQT